MAQSSSTEIRDAIAAAIEQFMAAFSRGDAAGCAALYTEQGQLLISHQAMSRESHGEVVEARPYGRATAYALTLRSLVLSTLAAQNNRVDVIRHPSGQWRQRC